MAGLKEMPPPPSDSDENESDDSPPPKKMIPPKKRFGDADDEENVNFSDSDSAPSVGSDLYKGDSDKEELESMTELQREMLLAERGTKIDDYRLRKKAQMAVHKRKESPLRSRSSARLDHRTAAKTDALNVLRAKRMKNALDSGRVVPMDGSDSESGEEEDGMKSGDDDDDDDDPEVIKNVNDIDDESITYEDVKEITIRRSKLAKWVLEPFFEELIQGCFVRLGVGKSRSGWSVYKLCLVKNVDSTDKGCQYKLEGRNTIKYLNLVWGADSTAARWPMSVISDSPPELDEFKSWLQAVESSGGQMLTRGDLLNKKEAIDKINSFVYSAASVKQMLQVKKSISSRPLNTAAEKDRLRKEMEVAEQNNNEAEMERIRDRLKELDDVYQQKDPKAVRLAEMNKKNRAENFKNASEVKPVNTSLKAGEAGYDPFSRRWTRSSNYYVSKAVDEANALGEETNPEGAVIGSGDPNEAGSVNGLETGVAATAATLEAAEGAGKLVDTSAPAVTDMIHMNPNHNFKLPISLAGLEKYGGSAGAVAGYLARKAHIEAKFGYRVPEDDGKQHPVTLTISDYKRRMGLI